MVTPNTNSHGALRLSTYFIVFLFLATLLVQVQFDFVSAVNAATLSKSQDVQLLEPGKQVARELAGNQTHNYRIILAAGQFLHIIVEQLGIDVVVRLYSPDGTKVSEVDSPNGVQGPEPLIVIAEASGVYRLEIRSLEEKAAPGRYEARIAAVRNATAQDKKRISDLLSLKEAEQLTDRVLELNRQRKYDEAIPLAQRVLVIREEILGADHADVAAALNNLAEMNKAKGDFRIASQLLERAISIKQKALGEEHPGTATSLLNLAVVYRDMWEFARAEPLYNQALSIFEKAFGPSDPRVAQALNHFALFYDLKGDYPTSESLYLRALAIRQKALGEHSDTGITLANLTDLYREMGNIARAEEFGLRALAVFEKALGRDHPYVATALNNLALVYIYKGDFRRAAPLYERALLIGEKELGSEHPDVVAALFNVASLYVRTREIARAEQLYQRVLAIDEKRFGKDHPNVASDLTNLAFVNELKGDRSTAELLYHLALAISEKAFPGGHPQVATILNNLSSFYRQKGNLIDAQAMGERSLKIREKMLGELNPDVATSLSNLAAVYEAKDDIARAIRYRMRGNDIRENNLLLILARGSEHEKLSYMATFATEMDLTISLHSRSAPTNTEAVSLALTTILRRKGRVLDAMSEQGAILRRNLDKESQALFDELASVHKQLAALIRRGPENKDQAQYRIQVSKLESEAERLQAGLSNRSLRFRLQSQPITTEQAQRAIPADGALVEIINYSPYDAKTGTFDKNRYCAYVLREMGPPLWVDLGEEAEIDRNVLKLQRALGDPTDSSVKLAARELGKQIFLPIRKLLGNAHHIFLSPDGALNLIPFAAFVDDRGRYLLEDYTITYLPSGRDLLRLQINPESRTPPLIIADPLFNRPTSNSSQAIDTPISVANRRSRDAAQIEFRRLPGTADEAKALAAILPEVEVLTLEKATETALRRVTAPRILHIATHGFFLPDEPGPANPTNALFSDRLTTTISENPLLRSGLALAGANQQVDESGDDGILTALEATGLDLWGTKLVVLSACETGLGKVKNGEGVYGLRRALVLAGSETQVMSLWKVSDRGTRDLMTAYYTRLQQGEGRAAALRQVQLMMLRGQLKPKIDGGQRGTIDTGEKVGQRDYRKPYYWAAFIQSGNWRNMDGN